MKWVRRSLYVIGGLLVLILLVGAGGYLWLRTSLPQTTGSVVVPRLGAKVEIVRDGDGVVTIRAQSEADAFYALGFAHAQDRLFQMDMMRRLGAGRLSEVVGDATVSVDKTMRILGLYRAAEAGLAKLPNEMRVTMEAYAAGVNAFLDTHGGTLPPEFALLGYSPEPWRPGDSLVWGRLMALQLSGNWSEELLRYRLAARLTPAQLNDLWRAPPADDLGIPQAEKPDDHAAAAPALPDVLREKGASNNFVVAGSRSATGKPLLANDPHLGLQSPIQWYLVRLETPTLTLVGATAPGVPMLVIGHNGQVAWSFVTTASDTQDLFFEKLLPGDPTHYLAPAGPLAFESRSEIIKVEGAEDIALTVRRSRHGPILSDAPSLEWTDPAQVLSLAWPGLEEDDGTAAALYRMNRARNAGELLAAAVGFGSPMQNILYADTEGHIGFIAPGRMPLRKKLNAASQMPAPGWTGDYDWTGYQPVDSLPQIADPEQGWIATANNDIRPEDYGRFLSGRWEAPYRYDRIAELLEETPRQTPDTLAAIQLDTVSLAAAEELPIMLSQYDRAPKFDIKRISSRETALELLRAWDFRVSRDRPEPLIFLTWLVELNRIVLSERLASSFEDYAASNLRHVVDLVSADDLDWCGKQRAPEFNPCDERVRDALLSALAKLSSAYGSDPKAWRWGDAHQARFGHPIFDRIPILGALVRDPIATDGDDSTINRATPRVDFDSVVFPDVHGAGLRAVFDLADLDRSRFIIAGGQSGNPLSAHYHDFIERWRDGRYVELRGEGADILTLMPSTQ
jgi:penicillin amidase